MSDNNSTLDMTSEIVGIPNITKRKNQQQQQQQKKDIGQKYVKMDYYYYYFLFPFGQHTLLKISKYKNIHMINKDIATVNLKTN